MTDILEVAVDLVGALAKDPVLGRLIEAFRLMPSDDREVIVGAIEREVRARRISRATEETTGQQMHPNRNARLYVRAHETPALGRNPERDELMLSMLRGLKVIPLLLAPDIHETWIDATREALDHLEPTAHSAVIEVMKKLVLLAEETVANDALKRAAQTG